MESDSSEPSFETSKLRAVVRAEILLITLHVVIAVIHVCAVIGWLDVVM